MLLYIIESSICLSSFYLFYKLFIENESIHIIKRFYLLGSLIVAFSIPLITFTIYIEPILFVENNPAIKIDNVNQIQHTQEADNSIFIPTVLWTFYGLGVLLFTLKFLYNLVGIIDKITKNPKSKQPHFTYVLLHRLVIPHTFFNYIFLNKGAYEKKQIPKEVILHEETHARQKHSLDLILVELLQVVFWFNPLLYLMKTAIKLNHEFLADQAVLNHGVETSTYQKTLLMFSSNLKYPQLSNALNYSSIKKRFTLMKTKTSSTTIWIRSLILLPLLSVLIYSFSDTKIVQKESNKTENIFIQVTKNKQILIDGKKIASINVLTKEIKKTLKKYNPDQLRKVTANIQAEENIEMGFITDISREIVKAGITHRKLNSWRVKLTPQDKATPAQIVEYNALAKYYNTQSKNNIVIKLKDIERVKYIYNLMTAEQKKAAEPFPNFPPPPASDATPITPHELQNEKLPPPPPIPSDATPVQKEAYEKAVKNYKNKKTGYTYKHKTEEGETVDVVVITDEKNAPVPPPPTPELPENTIPAQKQDYQKENVNHNRQKSNISSAPNVEPTEVDNPKTPIPPSPPLPADVKNEHLTESNEKENNTVLPPPLPPNPVDHIKDMAEKGAEFYFKGSKISTKKAIEIVKNNKNINIQIKEQDSEKPIVKLATNPIIIED